MVLSKHRLGSLRTAEVNISTVTISCSSGKLSAVPNPAGGACTVTADSGVGKLCRPSAADHRPAASPNPAAGSCSGSGSGSGVSIYVNLLSPVVSATSPSIASARSAIASARLHHAVHARVGALRTRPPRRPAPPRQAGPRPARTNTCTWIEWSLFADCSAGRRESLTWALPVLAIELIGHRFRGSDLSIAMV